MASSRWLMPSHFALMALLATPALADNAADAETAAEVQTVVVTGKKVEKGLNEEASNGALGDKKLLDTPFSVTVIDAEDISKRQANSVAQLFVNDPSVSSSSPSATTDWWGAQIRGLGVRNYYVDGNPMLLYWGGEFPLEAVETVEALKGLSGFMYGFGSPGGVISYSLKKPTDTKLLTTELGYRNDSVFYANIDAGGRLGEDQKFGYRVDVAAEKGDAYNGAGVNRTLGSVALDYRITPDLTWYGSAIYQDSKLEHEPLLFYWDSYTGDNLPEVTDDYDNVLIKGSYYKTKTLISSTGLKWQINDSWKANLVTGYTQKDHYSNKMFAYMLNEGGDYEGTAYNFSGRLKNYSTQATLQGQVYTGAIKHDIVVGAAYQKTTDQWGNEWYWSNDFNGNIYQKQTFEVTRDIDYTFAPVSANEQQTAAFASDTLHFNDKWQAIVGLRYTYYDQEDMDGDPTVGSGYSTDALTPTLALIYKPRSNVTVYGSYVESLEAGTRVGDTYANVGEILDATISKQLEVGLKLEQDRTSFTTAAFRVARAAQIDQYVDSLRYLRQDGLTVYQGLEAIGSYKVSDTLRVGLGATYLDASIEDVSPDNAAVEGNIPASAAKWQVAANADYDIASVRGLSLHGSVRYYGDAYYDDLNRVLIPHRTLANVGFQYRTEMYGHGVTFTGNINNLFNTTYWEMNGFGEGINGALSMKVNW